MKKVLPFLRILAGMAVFVLLVLAVAFFSTELVREKRGDVVDFGEYRAEERDSIDVIFLGSSHVFMNVLPTTIWESEGITSYNVTSSVQVPAVSYYYLVEALKTQSPLVVAYDPYIICQRYPDEWRALLAMGALPLSKNKLEAIENAVPEEYRYECRFELFAYHNNWNRLRKYDWTYALTKLFHADKVSFLKGSEISLDKVSATNQAYFYQPIYTLPDEDAYAENFPFLLKIAETVKEAGAELLLFSTPCPNAGMTEYYLDRVEADLYAAGYEDVKVLDLNKYRNAMQFDYSRDMTDGTHCNATGAKKVSRQLASWLRDNYEFPDRRADEKLAALWDAGVPLLDEYIENGVYRPWTEGAVVK